MLGALMLVYGFSYMMYGVRQFLGLVGYDADSYIVQLNLSIGVITFVIGIGLLLVKEWARIAQLAAVTMLLSEHIFFLAISYLTGLNLTLQILNVILIVLLFVISWSKLTKPDVIQHFRGETSSQPQ